MDMVAGSGDTEKMVGDLGIGNKELGTIDNVIFAIGYRADLRGTIKPAARLSQGQGHNHGSSCHLRQQASFLLLAPSVKQDLPGQHRRSEHRAREEDPPHFLGNDHLVYQCAIGTFVLGGQQYAQPAQVRHLPPEFR